jgi:hypothetical protein
LRLPVNPNRLAGPGVPVAVRGTTTNEDTVLAAGNTHFDVPRRSVLADQKSSP